MSLRGDKFICRFLIHTLPRGFRRILHFYLPAKDQTWPSEPILQADRPSPENACAPSVERRVPAGYANSEIVTWPVTNVDRKSGEYVQCLDHFGSTERPQGGDGAAALPAAIKCAVPVGLCHHGSAWQMTSATRRQRTRDPIWIRRQTIEQSPV